MSNQTNKETHSRNINDSLLCLNVIYNSSEFRKLPNGSIWIQSHLQLYNRDKYGEFSNGLVLLCANFSVNYTMKFQNKLSNANAERLTAAQIVTIVGLSLSIASLMCLIAKLIYCKNTDTLHGKNLLCLSMSLLVFQLLFLFSGKVAIPVVCDLVTGTTHFFFLSTFAWMGIMAYSVSKAIKIGK